MSDIRLDEAGIAWTTCARCGQDVIPSHDRLRDHDEFCPVLVRSVGIGYGVDGDVVVRSVLWEDGQMTLETEHVAQTDAQPDPKP